MALMNVRIPRLQISLPIVDTQGRPSSEFLRRINEAFDKIETALNAQAELLNQIVLAQAAADAAQLAADTAAQAASDAQLAADTAQITADGAVTGGQASTREQALVNSYISPTSVISASPMLISIAAHTRFYTDGSSANVSAGTVPATAAGDTDYVSYLDDARTGGTVSYLASTTPPAQTGNVHVVGAVMIPATGTQPGGRGPRRPGEVEP